MSECNCSMRRQLVGDGCHVCNPKSARNLVKGELVRHLRSAGAIDFVTAQAAAHRIEELESRELGYIQSLRELEDRVRELEDKNASLEHGIAFWNRVDHDKLKYLEEKVAELDWISVEDRLPEEDGPYLCVLDWMKTKEVKTLWRIDKVWMCHGFTYPEVTKWRPLPKAE